MTRPFTFKKRLQFRTIIALLVHCVPTVLTMFAWTVALADVATVAPSTFSLNLLTGGTVSAVAIPSAGTGTGNRLPDATVCSALNGVAGPGVSLANPCNPAGVYGSVNVGAAPNSAAPQSFSASFTPAQLAAAVNVLATAGQPYGSRTAAGSFLSSPSSLL